MPKRIFAPKLNSILLMHSASLTGGQLCPGSNRPDEAQQLTSDCGEDLSRGFPAAPSFMYRLALHQARCSWVVDQVRDGAVAYVLYCFVNHMERD